MHLNCPECRSPIFADDVNIVKTIAKCRECHNIFEFTKELEKAGLPAPARQRKEVIIPTGVELLTIMDELEIMINWRKTRSSFLPFFAVLWVGFVFIFTLIVLFAGQVIAILFMVPFWIAGLYLIYASLGYLFNTTYILVDEYQLSVLHKPINFLIQKDQFYHPNDIQQLYVKRYSEGESNGNPVYAYSVEVLVKGHPTVQLVKGLRSADHARFIEQEIEHHLKITDRQIRGEWVYE
ncbi:MAG: hypothetical protein AAFP19_01740 [Bacteroidota bacterium]